MQDFTKTTEDYNTDPGSYCKEPAMLFRRKYSYRLYHDDYELDGLPDSGRIHFWYAKDRDNMPRKKRQPAQPSSKFNDRLITSVHEQHSASELCQNDHSYGPDFVSFSDNMFCDMSTKQTWPLCDVTHVRHIKDECYDMITHSLITHSEHVKRKHVRVQNWD